MLSFRILSHSIYVCQIMPNYLINKDLSFANGEFTKVPFHHENVGYQTYDEIDI